MSQYPKTVFLRYNKGRYEYKFIPDCLFEHKGTKTLIAIESKASWTDTNSLRSALFNSIAYKESQVYLCGECGPYEKKLYYYVGNLLVSIKDYLSICDNSSTKKSKTTQPLLKFALDNKYFTGIFGYGMIDDLKIDIEEKCK